MLENLSATDCIVLDTCSILTLYSTGIFGEIISATEARIAVVEYVLTEEVKWVYAENGIDKEEIDLYPYITEEQVSIVEMTEDEQNTALNIMYADHEDGEAVTTAVAHHRNWALATDEKKVITYIRTSFPDMLIFTSVDIIKNWADQSAATNTQISTVLNSVAKRRRHRIARNHPLKAWWLTYIAHDETQDISEKDL